MNVSSMHVAVPQVVIPSSNLRLNSIQHVASTVIGQRERDVRAAYGGSFGQVMEVAQLFQLIFNSIEPKHITTPTEGKAGKELCIHIIK